ncbi:MAG: hypothetical protein ABI665_10325 [Vicinamibacterales bacterium]
MRLEFYENWLSPAGMRDGRIGLAPLGAVLSFLHREEPPINEQIAVRAGTCAADWTFADVSGAGRWLIRRLPTTLRVRAALTLVRRLVKGTIRQSRVKARFARGTGLVEIRSAAFEQLRDPAAIPMRGFYAAAVRRILVHCAIDAEVGVAAEHETGWSLTVSVRSPRRVEAVDAA